MAKHPFPHPSIPTQGDALIKRARHYSKDNVVVAYLLVHVEKAETTRLHMLAPRSEPRPSLVSLLEANLPHHLRSGMCAGGQAGGRADGESSQNYALMDDGGSTAAALRTM